MPKLKSDIALRAQEGLEEMKECCDDTSGTHHTNYILHADWRLESRGPR